MITTYDMNTNILPFFSGTYNTIWEPRELDDEGMNEVEIDYTLQDLMRSIAEAYTYYADYIKTELGLDFIVSCAFSGTFHSPREYNFSTDTLDFTLTIDTEKLEKRLEALKDDSSFSQYLINNFRSRDGFWSFTPDNYPEIVEQIRTDGDQCCQALGAVITYLVGAKTLEDIEETVYEHWSSNGYMGLPYQVVEASTPSVA